MLDIREAAGGEGGAKGARGCGGTADPWHPESAWCRAGSFPVVLVLVIGPANGAEGDGNAGLGMGVTAGWLLPLCGVEDTAGGSDPPWHKGTKDTMKTKRI